MINNYYPLHLYTIGFYFLFSFVIVRGVSTIATRAKLNIVSGERTLFLFLLFASAHRDYTRTHAQRLLWSPRSCRIKWNKKSDDEYDEMR